MHFFLTTYRSKSYYGVSKGMKVFGMKSGPNRNALRKFMKLEHGDIVVIRDSSLQGELAFFGHCVVEGEPYFHATSVPQHRQFPDFIWEDEEAERRVIYPCRVAVRFDDIPSLAALDGITWDDLIGLGVENQKGEALHKLGWVQMFKGNFIMPKHSGAFAKLVGYRG